MLNATMLNAFTIHDWFAVLAAISVLLVVALHGSLWTAQRTAGRSEARARATALNLYWPVCAVVLANVVARLSVQPHLMERFSTNPELWLFPVIGIAGLMGVRFCLETRWNVGSFLCSGVFIAGLLCSLFMWIPALLLMMGYAIFVFHHFRGNLAPESSLVDDAMSRAR